MVKKPRKNHHKVIEEHEVYFRKLFTDRDKNWTAKNCTRLPGSRYHWDWISKAGRSNKTYVSRLADGYFRKSLQAAPEFMVSNREKS